MKKVFVISPNTRVDGPVGNTRHLMELFEHLQEYGAVYLIAPYEEEKPDRERILSVPTDSVPIPVVRTILYKSVFLFHLVYQTVKRSPDVFYYRQSPLGLFPPLVAKAFGIPLVVEVNGILPEEHKMGGKRPWLTGVIRAIERIAFGIAAQFVVVTPGIAEYVHRQYDVPKNRITHVPNGADVALFYPRKRDECKEQVGLESDASYVCFVGNLAPWQGLNYLLRSIPSVISAVPDARLLIVGDGVLRDELEELAAELDLDDDVVFTGNVPYEQVPSYVGASDVCVVYKKPIESGYSPLKLYEYMACGRPVVASDTKGFEVLEEHNAGVLAPPEDADALATAIAELLRDDEARATMGQNGRQYVEQHRSWQKSAKEVANVIEETMYQQ